MDRRDMLSWLSAGAAVGCAQVICGETSQIAAAQPKLL
jgi:hypothetical protein